MSIQECGRLRIKLFGSFEVVIDDRAISGKLLQRYGNRLLALLTLHSGRPLRSDWIVERLWGDNTDLGRRLDSLRHAVSSLRAQLGDDGKRIEFKSNTISIDLEGADVDVITFERYVTQGDTESLKKAVDLYRGGLLQDWNESWILERREAYQEQYLDAIKLLSTAAAKAHEYDRAAYYLRQFTRHKPELDAAWAQLIDVYRMGGNTALAEDAYADYRAFLNSRADDMDRNYRESPRVTASIEEMRSGILAPALYSACVTPPIRPLEFDPVGGAVPLESPYYLRRNLDDEAHQAVHQRVSFLLLRGARQVGKTSMLGRVLKEVRSQGAIVIHTDWQSIPQAHLNNADAFLRDLADTIAEQLGTENGPEEHFNPSRPPTRNFERFFRRTVLTHSSGTIVWGIDEADRLFGCSFRDDIFAMMRSWHNERSLNSESPWRRLTVAMAYATEAHLISNLNQSPFNVGFRVDLQDFTRPQVEEMNRRYGSPISTGADLDRLMALVGGHPYLVRRTLQEMTLRSATIQEIASQAEESGGVFRDHLGRLQLALQSDPDLFAAARAFAREDLPLSEEQFERLTAAGVMVGTSRVACRPRCRLYAYFLERDL